MKNKGKKQSNHLSAIKIDDFYDEKYKKAVTMLRKSFDRRLNKIEK